MLLFTPSNFGDEVVLNSIDWLENLPWRQVNGIRKKSHEYEICLCAKDFGPKEISVKIDDGFIVIEGKHEEKKDDQGYISRHFVRRFPFPEDIVANKVESVLSPDGFLTIIAPRKSTPKRDTVVIPVTHESKAKCKL